MTNQERFTVWHLMPEFTRDAYTKVEDRLSRFTLVATVEAPCYQAVFDFTNHGVPGRADNWTDNPEVVELFTPKDRTRSTSVGDLVSDENGTFYRVEGMGWRVVQMSNNA
jgi:hypothetical protein